jgi:DNA mismatch repair protein MutS2
MVTTHHPELKIYSVETPGVRNASVEFDLETLAPTYRLIIGLPGRSNALAIAKRLGLDEGILGEARGMVTTEDLIADDLLDEIHRTREDIRRQQAAIAQTREQIENERAELSVRLNASEDERRNIIAAARRDMQRELDEFRQEMRRLRKDMRDASLPLDALRQVQMGIDSVSDGITQPVSNAVDLPAETTWQPKLGDLVWLETLKSEGTIVELEREEASVQIGSLRVRAKIAELKKPTRSEAKELKRRRVSAYQPDAVPEAATPKPASPGLELDLRGARVEDAIEKLEEYIDAAYLSGLPFARIIHGKGTGALRRAVQERVRQHPLISKVTAAAPKEGGDGVTVIHLSPQT